MDGGGAVLLGEVAVHPGLLPIEQICGGRVEYRSEGGCRYIFMEGLKFVAQGAARQMDALLCLNYPNPTYPTKLYLPEQIAAPGLNWNETAYILARSWETWSWSGVSPGQPPLAILAGHLKAFQ